MFFLFLFGIGGVFLFSGKLHYRCTEPGASEFVDDVAICKVDADCEGSQTCEFYEQNPANGALSYDNCLWAFVTIFQAVSLEGWVDQMYMLSVTTNPTMTMLYYVLLVVLGAMFIVNLFLAVIFEAFMKNQDMNEETEPTPKLPPPTGVEWVVYILIMGNTVSMCAEYYGETPEHSAMLELLNYFFCFAFSAEMLIKIMRSGPKEYFASGWNVFDFTVTSASLIDLGLDMYGHDTEFLRALRVARVLRLLRLNSNMQRFEKTFISTWDPMINMCGVLFLIMVVFAMLGMELFGGKLGAEPPRTNFDHFGSSFVTTFVVTSGENWNDVFADSLSAGSAWVSVAFFVPLFIMGNYVLVNLFVAIICWGWESAVEEDEDQLSEEEKLEIETLRLQLSHNLSVLQSEHAELMLSLQELISQRALGFSATFGSRLMSRMMSLMKDYTSALEQAIGPTSSATELRTYGGIALGFASLVRGLGQLLDSPESTENSTPEISLLCEYWDSEHARISGAVGSTDTVSQLHLALKRYMTTITANKTLMKAVSEMRVFQREIRIPRPDKAAEALKKGGKPGSTKTLVVAPPEPDPLGADYLPLKIAAPGGACIRQLKAIVSAPAFGNFIIFCILASSAALAVDMPDVLPDSPTANTLELLDYLFTTIFSVEMILKLIAFGACAEPDGYFRSGWNVLDGVIVISSLVSLFLSDVEGLSVVRALRVARTLRPLRVIQRNPGLRQVVSSLFMAVPGVLSVAQVCAIVMIVYGRFLMQFLMGKMRSCNDPSVETMEACVGTFVNDEGVTLPRWWGNDDIGNFDNIGMACLTLFEMSTLEMWPDLMFRAMDTDPLAKGMPLRQNANPWMAAYIIGWIVISAFFMLNLFVGVVLENFNAIRQKEDGSGLMDDNQKEWTRTITAILTVKPEKAIRAPGGKGGWASFRKRIFMLVQGDFDNKELPVAFEKFVITLVLLNVFSMAFTWYGQPAYMDSFADAADVIFTAAFTLEMLLKITGLGLRQYLISPWNRFDATLVTGALIADALQGLSSLGINVDPALLRMLRIFRIARLLRLMRVSGGLNRLITTMFVSIPALANVGMLLFLFMYIYAILGIELFHNLPLNGEFINEDANFASFGTAMMTLFRCITGESYNGIMHDAMITERGSAPGRCYDSEGNCGKPLTAQIFFISFFLMEALVMINLIVAVVLDAFAEEEKADVMKLPPPQMEHFLECWSRYDKDATCFMETKNLKNLIMDLQAINDEEPIGFSDFRDWCYRTGHDVRDATAREVTERLQVLAIPDREGKVAFHDVLEAIGKRAFKGDVELPAGSEAEKNLREKYGDVLRDTGLHNTVVSQYSSAYIFQAIRMQAAFRRRKAFKNKNPKEAMAAAKAARAGGNAFVKDARKQAAAGRPAASGRGAPPSKGKPPSRR
jgi:hypothetical protein